MRASAWLLTALLGACTPGKPEGEISDAATTPATNASAPNASGSGAPSIPSEEAWTGTYVSESGGMYVVDGGEWAGVKWRGDDASTGLGDGTIALTVDREPRRVNGTGSGALGDIVMLGALDGQALTASVLRKDPLDRGLTGTALGKVWGDRIVGTMKLSLADARVIREARFILVRSKP